MKKFCHQCGTENAVDATFCTQCGSSISAAESATGQPSLIAQEEADVGVDYLNKIKENAQFFCGLQVINLFLIKQSAHNKSILIEMDTVGFVSLLVFCIIFPTLLYYKRNSLSVVRGIFALYGLLVLFSVVSSVSEAVYASYNLFDWLMEFSSAFSLIFLWLMISFHKKIKNN